MTFGGALSLETLALAAGVLGGLAVVAYLLKMRRRRFEVPFSKLWQRVLREQESTSLWRRLKRLLSLLLQLALLGLLLLAAADPQLGQAAAAARNVVVILDASASMKARDEGPGRNEPRIAAARARAHQLISSLGGGDAAMVLRMDGQSTPLSRFESDLPLLHRVIDQIQPNDTPADLRRALSAAADALRGRQNPLIVLIGDGAYPAETLASATFHDSELARPRREPGEAPATDDPAEKRLAAIDLTGIDVRFLPIGHKADNLGIVAFNVRRYITNKTSYEVFIEVQNFGDKPARAKLTLYNADLAIDVQELEIPAGERVRHLYPDLAGGDDHRLRAELALEPGDGKSYAAEDVFALDDTAYALLPERKKQTVLLVTRDHLYLEAAMLVYDNIQVDKLLPEEYEATVARGALPTYDAIFFDDVAPAVLPPTGHLAYFDPPAEHSPFPIDGVLNRPRVTEALETHPVMRWVLLDQVNFDQSSVFKVNRDAGEVALALSIRSPIAAAKRDGARKIVAFGFSLSGTDMVMRVAFPLLMVNTLEWFAGDDADLITTYTTGRRFHVPMDGTFGAREVEVRDPRGQVTRAPIVDGQATFVGTQVGFHTLTAVSDGATVRIQLAANLADPSESKIAPVATLSLGGRELAAPSEFAASHRRALWLYLALAFVALLAGEWITYNRRITV